MNNAPYREEDFALIKEFGFNYVRLPVDYRCYTEAHQWLSFREDVLRDFDQAVAWGEKYGLHVTLALHRAPGYCVNPPSEAKDLWSNDEALAAFTAHWEMFLGNVIQSGRGYYMPVTHYRASWRDATRDYMTAPSWPLRPAVNANLYGTWKEQDGLKLPLVLRGTFPAQTRLDVRVLIVSHKAALVIKADGKPVFEKLFEPKDGVGE